MDLEPRLQAVDVGPSNRIIGLKDHVTNVRTEHGPKFTDINRDMFLYWMLNSSLSMNLKRNSKALVSPSRV